MAVSKKFPHDKSREQQRFSKPGLESHPDRHRLKSGEPSRFARGGPPRPFRERYGPPQPERRHPCPHFPACYGCPYAQYPYLQQLEKKRARVVEALAGYSSLRSIAIPLLVPSPRQFGYRTRVKLVVRRVGGKPVIGLYKPETHQVIDASECAVHPRQVNSVVQFLLEAIDHLGIDPYDEERDTGQLRYLDIRYSLWSRQVLLTLVTRHMHFPQARELVQELDRRFPFLMGIVQNIHDKPGNVIWGDRFYPLRGRDSLFERFGPLRLNIPVSAFAQANPPVALRMYETVRDWAELKGDEITLDLYCGIGPIALHLAGKAKLVIGIDDNVGSINSAKENARRNGYNNTRFFAGDAAEKLREMTTQLAQIGLAVVNPPRKGLSPEAFTAVCAVKAPKLIYVSCDPETLARDLDRFAQAEYVVQRLQSFDMFPQTDQVETVVLLTPQAAEKKVLAELKPEASATDEKPV